MQYLINGQPTLQLPATDRGLAYGHGVFETIRIHAGRLIFAKAHWQRLVSGCERLNISTLNLVEQLEADTDRVALPDDGVCKVMVTAGSAGRGYSYSPDSASPTRIVQISDLPDWSDQPAEQGIRARWCSFRLALQPALVGIKHLNRLEQVMARAEWSDPAIREGLVCDAKGYVCEGTMSNLFIVREGKILTPELDRCGIAGIMRNAVLRLADKAGIPTTTARLTQNDVMSADEVFVSNSLIGLWPVVQLDSARFSIGKMTRRLQQLLDEEYEVC